MEKAGKKQKEQRCDPGMERVKEVIAECFIKGYTKTRTIERVQRLTGEKMYAQKLNRLLDEVLAEWSKRGILDKVAMRAVELKRIDVREAELWQAWEESKALDDGGDARYLAELRRCSEQRSKLLGLAVEPSSKGKSRKEVREAAPVVWKESRRYGVAGQAGEDGEKED